MYSFHGIPDQGWYPPVDTSAECKCWFLLGPLKQRRQLGEHGDVIDLNSSLVKLERAQKAGYVVLSWEDIHHIPL